MSQWHLRALNESCIGAHLSTAMQYKVAQLRMCRADAVADGVITCFSVVKV